MIVPAPYQFSTSSCSDLKAWNKCGTRLVPLCPAFCSAAFCSRGTEWNKPCSAVVPSLQGGTTACAELVWSWNNHLESYLPLVPYAQLITTRNTNRNRNKLMKPLRTTPGSGRLTARSNRAQELCCMRGCVARRFSGPIAMGRRVFFDADDTWFRDLLAPFCLVPSLANVR